VIRIWLHSGSILVLIFTLALGVIHVHPRDDDAVRAFFAATPGCTAPCFMGIRPGVTTRDQSLAILRAQPWVGKLTIQPNNLSWGWNGSQPTFVSTVRGAFNLGQINFIGGIVTGMSVSTTTHWGDFLILFGAPDQEYFAARQFSSGYSPYLLHRAEYTEQGFEIDTNTVCPLKTRDDLWYSTITIVLPIQPFDASIRVRSC